jgi:GalNAc-alpha-(1->4)-GalNAc-alpha-(1->3)-diNAcBac-PP-undecaprenol alpha-1,4-N-acetyl-D-galactosaminyltransferase
MATTPARGARPRGMERVMSELAHYFCQQPKLEVHIILYGIARDVFYQLPENIRIHKPAFIFNNKFRIWSTLRTVGWLRRIIYEIAPTTVLSFGELWNNFVLLSTLGLKYPVFVSDRCQPNKSLGAFHDLLRNWLYPKAAGVICQTQTAKDIYSRMFENDNFVVIGNPIRKIDSKHDIPKENIVLTVGRLIKSKHHDELIRMFADINPKDWRMIIVGDDALRQKNKEKLEVLVQRLNMQGKIELVGKRSDVDYFYNRAKIFALTSSSEGFPNVLGEAMSAGLPVVAYDCVAGPSDLVKHEKTGFLIKMHDSKSFKEALEKLIKDENMRVVFAHNAKVKIQEFSIENIANQFKKTILCARFTD